MEIPHDALVYIPMHVICDPTIPNGEKDTIFQLLGVGKHVDRCDVDAAGLADRLGVTVRTMKKRLARLEERGLITVHDGWIQLESDLVADEDSVIDGPSGSPIDPGAPEQRPRRTKS